MKGEFREHLWSFDNKLETSCVAGMFVVATEEVKLSGFYLLSLVNLKLHVLDFFHNKKFIFLELYLSYAPSTRLILSRVIRLTDDG